MTPGVASSIGMLMPPLPGSRRETSPFSTTYMWSALFPW